MNFFLELFRADLIPLMAIRWLTKLHKSSRHLGWFPLAGVGSKARSSLIWILWKLSIHIMWVTLTYSSSLRELSLQALTLRKARFINWSLRYLFLGECQWVPMPDTRIKKRHYAILMHTWGARQIPLTPGLLSERIVTCHILDKTKERWCPTNPPHNQVTGISTTRLRSFIVYWPTPHHWTASKQVSQLWTTYTHSPPDPYLVEEESLHLLLSTDFFLFK